ncbi:MAG: TonB-dependent receptor [Pseudomonadota bacterium]|nr:TonB-dependent receptor [Pseudomonadota bacterium]
MTKPITLAAMLLATTTLCAPVALAQEVGTTGETPVVTEGQSQSAGNVPSAQPGDVLPSQEAPDEQVNVSVPGGGGDTIVVEGRRNVIRSTPEVVSVLSTQDIARTGEGNIAGALQRVTGLSVTGGGFVYVRGLGDRYSLALLNGLPLPSPEPLKRVVPLDLFPSNVIDSTLVQKSFSANFPGEFGGGVINLTTKSIPRDGFLQVGAGGSWNSETTGNLGYTYYGGDIDFLGFDDGSRDIPGSLQAAFDSGNPIFEGASFSSEDLQTVAISLANANTTLLQRNNAIPANWSASVTGGKSFDFGGATFGVIATGGISNRWRTRDSRQQVSLEVDLSGPPQTDFQRVITDNRVVVNGLLGFGLEFADHEIRFTNLYIRDTLKQARLGLGTDANAANRDILEQDTAWFERQLFNSQLVGEFRFDDLSVDLRGGYANSQREAPYERGFTYVRTNLPTDQDPTGDRFVNDLGGNKGDATIAFSDLNENLWAGGADIGYRFAPAVRATIGYAYTDTERESVRRAFQYRAANLPIPVQQLRPDFLLSDATIQLFDITLLETSAQDGTAAFEAKLRTHAGYGMAQVDFTDRIGLNAGVRYETAEQTVAPIDLFGTGSSAIVETDLDNAYWLPAATLTFEVTDRLQFRASASKTIARPQFRELIAQIYQDPESNRTFRGNPSLIDSELLNADARAEYYMGRDERLSAALFYKRIENPIEAFSSQAESGVSTSFANAPEASLYGVEIEAHKYFALSGLGGFMTNRRFVTIANYTFTKSRIKVAEGDETIVNGVAQAASNFFFDGAPLTGQSDHLANLQFGFENTERLSQQTLLLTYASKRVTSRGPSGQPDIFEFPGLVLDFVAREGFEVAGRDVEVKFEARNLTGRRYEESQRSGENRIFLNRYKVGTTFALGASVKF